MYACLLSECIITKCPGLGGTGNLALYPGCMCPGLPDVAVFIGSNCP